MSLFSPFTFPPFLPSFFFVTPVCSGQWRFRLWELRAMLLSVKLCIYVFSKQDSFSSLSLSLPPSLSFWLYSLLWGVPVLSLLASDLARGCVQRENAIETLWTNQHTFQCIIDCLMMSSLYNCSNYASTRKFCSTVQHACTKVTAACRIGVVAESWMRK